MCKNKASLAADHTTSLLFRHVKTAVTAPGRWLCQLTQLKADVFCRLKTFFYS